ncbi:MAG TPA: DUF4430 domain-containing protein [Solirubrobacteraceae bacterium]|nr:DUF4430 domain-containing protein [Solirubrobacteraceae bacterium]
MAALCALAGCGLGAGNTPKGVQLTVTRDFGARVLLRKGAPRAVGEETVMSLLRRNAAVSTRFGGGFVQSIDGVQGGSEGGDQVDWFYYVNGVEATKGAAATVVHPGDRVWWDRHDWSQTDNVPAVIGSFPQPLLSGYEGKRVPVRVECVEVESTSCQGVLDRLRSLGVLAAVASVSGGDEPYTLRVLVGQLSQLAADPGVHQIEAGPRYSGVYARFGAGAKALQLLDGKGQTVLTLGARSGLLAATRYREEAPVWVVSGTDEAGVERAAGALSETALRDRFAIALPETGGPIGLPVPEPVARTAVPPAGAANSKP